MRNQIKQFVSDTSMAELVEYTSEGDPFLYTVIFSSDDMETPTIESFEVEENNFDAAKIKALKCFNKGVINFLSFELNVIENL